MQRQEGRQGEEVSKPYPDLNWLSPVCLPRDGSPVIILTKGAWIYTVRWSDSGNEWVDDKDDDPVCEDSQILGWIPYPPITLPASKE